MTQSVISLTDFKSDASRLLKELNDSPRSLVLTQNGRASAVVQDYESFQRQQDALLMLRLMAQGEADVRDDKLTGQAEVFAQLRQRISGR